MYEDSKSFLILGGDRGYDRKVCHSFQTRKRKNHLRKMAYVMICLYYICQKPFQWFRQRIEQQKIEILYF